MEKIDDLSFANEEAKKTYLMSMKMRKFRIIVLSVSAFVWLLTITLSAMFYIKVDDADKFHFLPTWGIISTTVMFLTILAITLFARGFSKLIALSGMKAAKQQKENLDIISTLTVNFSAVYYYDVRTEELAFLQIGDRIQNYMGKVYAEDHDFAWYVRAYAEKLVIPEYRDEFCKVVDAKLISERLAERDYFTYRYLGYKSGKAAYYEMKAAKVNDDPTKLVIGFADVDDEARDELERNAIVKESLDQVSLANSVKDKFLANVSHELLTPLNEALGIATLMSIGANDESEIVNDATKIASATNVAINLINDLIYSSKIESGEMLLHETMCSLTEILDSMIVKASEDALLKRVRINRYYSFSHDIVNIDAEKLRVILDRILKLSISYSTPDSNVEFEVKEGMTKDDKALFEIKITDYSEGLAKAGFVKGEVGKTLTDDPSPAGVAFSISRRLVELLGGKMTVSGSPDRGTAILIKLFLKTK